MTTQRKHGNHQWSGVHDSWQPAKDHPAFVFIGSVPFLPEQLQIKMVQCPCGVTKIMVRRNSNSGTLGRMATYVYNQKTSHVAPPCSLDIDGID